MVDSKPKSIPQWQRQDPIKDSKKPQGDKSENVPDATQSPTSTRAALVDQASKFLQKEEIRDSSTGRKIEFLESKGLTNEEIHNLLGVSKNIEATTTPPTPTLPDATPTTPSDTSLSTSAKTPSSNTPSTILPNTAPIPPIITYPEFLLPQPPPPLITTPTILKTLYVTLATSAVIYTASTYLLNPMLDALTDARHSLFETASSKLETLNEKLSSVVSVLPNSHPQGHGEAAEDVESIISDPTELFHRDTGTQTSGPISPTLSSYSSPPVHDGTDPVTPIVSQGVSLRSLHTHFASALDSSYSVAESDETLEHSVQDLQYYLEGVRFGRLRLPARPTGSAAGRQSGMVAGQAGSDDGAAEDEIAKVKAEIRGFKGALLSAKNFPSGGRGRGWIAS